MNLSLTFCTDDKGFSPYGNHFLDPLRFFFPTLPLRFQVFQFLDVVCLDINMISAEFTFIRKQSFNSLRPLISYPLHIVIKSDVIFAFNWFSATNSYKRFLIFPLYFNSNGVSSIFSSILVLFLDFCRAGLVFSGQSPYERFLPKESQGWHLWTHLVG
jgi:hypothetical protein